MSVEEAAPLEQTNTTQGHSRSGKISLALAVCNILVMVALAAGFAIGSEIHLADKDERFFLELSEWCFAVFLYYIFSAAPLGFVAGLVLGILSLLGAGKKKRMGVIGLILNALFLLVVMALDVTAVMFFFSLLGDAPG
jgi:hypothetical protein